VLLTWFNIVEGIFWLLLAAVMAAFALRRGRHTDLLTLCCLLMIAFGVSDFAEVRSGAWFRPWWLFVWKAMNVMGFALLYWIYRRRCNSARGGARES
jgi:hypothetical protein